MVKREFDVSYEPVGGKITLTYDPSKNSKHISLSFEY
jgi:hypothetical protein